jgi:hypothetical protein
MVTSKTVRSSATFSSCVQTEKPQANSKVRWTSSGKVINIFIHWKHDNHLHCSRCQLWWTGKVCNQTLQIDTKIFVTPEFLRLTCNILDTERERQTKRDTIEWSHIVSPDCFLWPFWHAKSWTKWSGACSDVTIRYIWMPIDVILGYRGVKTKCWDENV